MSHYSSAAPTPHVGPGRATFCAGIVARNEGTFLKESVESVIDAVDEVIIVENGSLDDTLEVARGLAALHSKVRVIELPGDSFLADARNAIDAATQCDWILWWDADFIAWSHEEAPTRSVYALLERIRNAPELNQVLYGGPNVGLSFDTYAENKPFQGNTGDTQVTRKGLMRFKVERYIDTRYFTGERKTLYLNRPETPFILHLDRIKPLARMILRQLQYKFETTIEDGKRDDDTFREWVLTQQPNFSLRANKTWMLKRSAEQARVYDFAVSGPHPKILAEQLAHPYYEATVDNDRVIEFKQSRAFSADAALDAYFEKLGLA